MPKANADHTTPRRGFLGAAAALSLAAVPGAAQAAFLGAPKGICSTDTLAAAPDPALAVYAQIRAIERQQHPLQQRIDFLRARLVKRWGAYPASEGNRAERMRDPDRLELLQLVNEADRLGDKIGDLIDVIGRTDATTAGGVAARLRVVISEWPTYAGLDYHDQLALPVMQNALRLLTAIEAGRAVA